MRAVGLRTGRERPPRSRRTRARSGVDFDGDWLDYMKNGSLTVGALFRWA